MKRLFFAVLLLGMSAAEAEIYKWVDDNGQVHYSEKKPESNSSSTEIHIKKHAPQVPLVSPQQRKQKQENLLRAFEEERELRNEAKAKKEKEEAKNQHNCIMARDRLKSYERASVLYNLDEKGERIYYSDAQRRQAEANLRSQIKKWCD